MAGVGDPGYSQSVKPEIVEWRRTAGKLVADWSAARRDLRYILSGVNCEPLGTL